MVSQLSTPRALGAGLAFTLASFVCVATSAQETKSTFESLAKAQATAEIIELWRQHPFEALPTIDSYLEGSLKLIETTPSTEPDTIRGMHANAMAGAQAADKAFGTIVFSEYASSFIGWNREQQKQFRLGQKASRDAKAAMHAKRFAAALSAGQDCVNKAQPLGDWWGTAMGFAAIGAAEKALGHPGEALTAFTLSRNIYHDLRLGGAELNCVVEMAGLLKQANSLPRAKVTCQQGIALAEELGDRAAKATLSKILSELK